jgi:ribosome-binding factor A
MPGFRKERLEKSIRMIIADALLKDVKDPRIGFVTVTGVNLNKDKSVATVSVSVLGDGKAKKNSMIGLNSAKGFFQFMVGKGIEMRNTPKVIFQLDSSIEYEANMLGTLDKIRKEEGRPDEDINNDDINGDNEA